MSTTENQPAPSLAFRWQDLPAISADLPGTGGVIRERLEDFIVEEIPAYEPSGSGDHTYALIEKRGLTTIDVVAALARAGVPRRDIGFAGLKDKHAVTTQWFSIPHRFEPMLAQLDDENGVRVISVSRHRNKLSTGHLRGNRFEIHVRRPTGDWPSALDAVRERLAAVGLPNYVGPQRFGRFNGNVRDGLRLLNGERVPGGRRLEMLFLNSVQAHIFNHILAARIEAGLFTSVVMGDMARKHDTGGTFLVEDPAVESVRAARLEISATIPMLGKRVTLSVGEAGRIEASILDRFGLSAGLFENAHGDRRISRILLDSLTAERSDSDFVLRFALPKGSFATTLLREITKLDIDAPIASD